MYLMALSNGLDADLLKDMTVGNTIDYIIESHELHKQSDIDDKKDKVRMAVQQDFDNF